MGSNRSTSGAVALLRGATAMVLLFAGGAAIGLVASMVVPPLLPSAAADGAAAVAAPTVDDEVSDCVPAPLAQRAAQVLVVGLPEVISVEDPLAQELTTLGVGGVFISDSNVHDAEQIRSLLLGLRTASQLPLLVTTDEEAGRVSTFRPVIGPTSSPRTLAARNTPEEVREFARGLGEQLAQVGITSDLAPVADLDGGPSQGVIGDRSFSADPLIAMEYAQAFATGLSDAGVVPVVKHFPGHGAPDGDVHRRAAQVDTPLEQLLGTDVLPFVALIDAGAPVVMLSHVTYTDIDPRRPASVSPATYTLLRDLGFEGVAMTDSVGMGAIHRRWKFPRASVMAVRAGADAVLATDGRQAPAMVDALVRAVDAGRLSEFRLNEAAARMLALKGVDPVEMTCMELPEFPRLTAAG